jgi:CheY-like chemotaxis protein
MLFGKRERTIRRILIVEDEPLVAFDTEHLLNEAGYEVVGTVDTLADATRLIQEEEIDLILSDIKLSGEGDGMDVARRLRRGTCPCCSYRQLPGRGAEPRHGLPRQAL